MKILNITRWVFLMSIIALLASCSEDDSNNDNANNTSANQVAEIATNGSWRITYFFDTDKEETDNFSGYTFRFNEDGTLTATNGSNTVSGIWSVRDDSSSSNDDSSDDDDFNIFFSVSPDNDFEDLNDDWDIISASSDKIELTDVSGGNGGTDFLTFERN